MATATALPDAPASGSKARRTYERLLDATERRLAAGGYAAATTAAIAQEAGVSTGTFYTYFDDREQILAAAFARRLSALLERVRAQLDPGALLDEGLEEVLRRAVDAVLDEYRRHAATYRAAIAQVPASEQLREVYWTAHRETEEVVSTFLRRAQAAGQARQDADPSVLALALIVVVQGANNPLLLAQPDAASTGAIIDELVAMLVHLLTRSA